ncbi:MAG: hypothetical protein EA393_08645 [Bacteroidetes bacterium]|nr:MAG: hypothetical protein EA393_08645 [Bacteroidota bacterium]
MRFFSPSVPLFLIFFITFGVGCSDTPAKRDFLDPYKLSDQEKALLKPGDIIMRRGYGFVSNTIVNTLREDLPVSHAGIIIKDSKERLRVIHSVSQTISDFDGVQEVDIDTFIRDSQPNTIVVVRYLDSIDNFRDMEKISHRTLHYLEQKIPFDYSFNLEDSTRFFCTEFIGRVYSDIFGRGLFDKLFPAGLSGLDKLKFGVFLQPELFEVIINHHEDN